MLPLSACRLPWHSPIVLKVADYELSEEEVKLRQKIALIFYPKTTDESAGLIQLRNAYIYAQILKQNGQEVTTAQLEAEDVRIETHSRDKETLKKIQTLFGDRSNSINRERYYRVFILPTLAERKIESFFNSFEPVQSAARLRAFALLERVSAEPRKFSSVLEKEVAEPGKPGPMLQNLCVSKEHGFEWSLPNQKLKMSAKKSALNPIDLSSQTKLQMSILEQMQKDLARAEESRMHWWANEVILPTHPGEVVRRVVDIDQDVAILYMVSKSNKKSCFQVFRIPKPDLHFWLEMEKKKFTVWSSKETQV